MNRIVIWIHNLIYNYVVFIVPLIFCLLLYLSIKYTDDLLQTNPIATAEEIHHFNKSNFTYFYDIYVKDVYDGDTITVDIFLGLDLTLCNQKLRLYGINAPEVRGKEKEKGLISKEYLRKKIEGKQIVMETIKDKTGKYGRLLAIIYDEKGNNLNDELVINGLAKVNFYK